MHLVPLTVEQKLIKGIALDVFSQLLASFRDRSFLSGTQCLRPPVPGAAAMSLFQRHEKGKVIQPRGIFRAEIIKGFAQMLLIRETGKCLLQKIEFFWNEQTKVHAR